jgi:NAD dependent epimerase/dehydratase family enzyme
MLGEGSVLLTEGQCVLPARTQEAGYRFRFTDLDAALNDLLA